MFKKIIAAAAAAAVCVSAAFAAPENGETEAVPVTAMLDDGVGISAECAIVTDAASGAVVWEHNADALHSMASTTKITTAITAIELGNLSDEVVMTKTALLQEGSSAYLREGDRVTLKEMLYALMLNSGNDAAVAIAEHISGSTDAFVEEMNRTARRAGAENTAYRNPNGLDAEGHYTTARDLAAITRYAMRNYEFAAIVATAQKRAEILNRPEAEQYFVNHNKLLRLYDGCIGVKTGYTEATGRCLVSAAARYGMIFIAVTLNDRNDWDDHARMLDYAFNNYKARTVVSKGQVIEKQKVGNEEYSFVAASDYTIAQNVHESERPVTVTAEMTHGIQLPLAAGDTVGEARIYDSGRQIGAVSVVSASDITREGRLWGANGIGDWCKYLAREWLRL